MRAYQILNETKTTLSALYKNGFPDRDEEFWNEVTRSDLDIPLEINKIAPYKLGIILTSQYRIEHIDELVLKGEQKRVVNQYRKDPNLSDSIIVMSDGRIIDGNHRALAAYLTKSPINYIDLSDLSEITEDEDYRIDHRAPMHDSGSPLYDLTDTYPDDIYGPNGVQYYGTREPWDARSIHVIKLCKGKPNQTVQIFRAVPKEVKSNTINPGDWVTASKEYAAQHGKGLGKYKLLSKIVPAKTLFTNGDSIHEWGYDPGGAAQPVAEDNASPTKISFKVKKGRGRFATEMIVNGQQAGVYQYDANTGRSIAEVFPEFRSQGLGKILVLHAIYTAAKLGLDFQEDESRTAAYDNVLDSLSSNGYIVDDDGYWYVTGEGEQYLQQALKNKAQPVAEDKSNRPISISKSVDGGSLEGYVIDSSAPNLTNYLHSQGASDDVINNIKSQYTRIAILRNMSVDEDNRGQGLGNYLVSNAIENAAYNGAEAIVLVSDTGEDNQFDLTKWYEGFGFEIHGSASGDPVMILEL